MSGSARCRLADGVTSYAPTITSLISDVLFVCGTLFIVLHLTHLIPAYAPATSCFCYNIWDLLLCIDRLGLQFAVSPSEGSYLYSLSLIHISEPTRLGMISYAVFCL